jgi:DNA-directed RNA polymerase subunit RPC12/RpoP
MFFYWCPNCPQKLHAEPEHVGYRARCPRCGKVHAVPDPDDPFLVGMDDPNSSRATRGRRTAAAKTAEPDPFHPFHGGKKTASDERSSNVFRRCPSCRRVVEVDNEWSGIICKYCGSEIAGG